MFTPRILKTITDQGLRSKAGEAVRVDVLQDPLRAYGYARWVIEGRWEEAEPIILTDAEATYYYWNTCLGDDLWPWPEAEPILAKSDWRTDYLDQAYDRYDEIATPEMEEVWKQTHGACAFCGEGLGKKDFRDRWHLSWPFDSEDEEFCSERCADRSYEDQYASAIEYTVTDLMHGMPADRIKEAVTAAKSDFISFLYHIDHSSDINPFNEIKMEQFLKAKGFLPE